MERVFVEAEQFTAQWSISSVCRSREKWLQTCGGPQFTGIKLLVQGMAQTNRFDIPTGVYK